MRPNLLEDKGTRFEDSEMSSAVPRQALMLHGIEMFYGVLVNISTADISIS
jgi:hypothetical protein